MEPPTGAGVGQGGHCRPVAEEDIVRPGFRRRTEGGGGWGWMEKLASAPAAPGALTTPLFLTKSFAGSPNHSRRRKRKRGVRSQSSLS